ncbi:hypothetical protein K443DRAFT_133309 [Laccaria amethystina LaAM-08-1]|uniref:Anaphase-promoting complex subunit 4-like WD40 domain-containing protein n=1 Tax=Laccaria amethystina LaAM-08-1 TaxID=1095629 RepID=A0A0C9WN54_9AGAR|nr:hypothetical protein K443DRAFT_133309 [Laccaria amethystina LaAM-08-1]
MSSKKSTVFPPNPTTARGVSTKLSSGNGPLKDKVIYANGKTIINPGLSVTYAGHIQNATVARISPSGYYCASADAGGTVRVWDTVGEDQVLKGEYKVISGRINDVAWDSESKRIIAVGDGRDKFGHAFMMDSGSSTGEIVGHSKAVNAVSIRHQRPFRAATAGDDGLILFHTGVPFKYEKTIKAHTKFVQDVKYAPSGDHFASVGSDAKIFLHDGKTGETLAEITESPHKGSIMAVSWSPDSKSLFTSSADCTVKLWDVETRKAATTWTLGTGIDHQQIGNIWSGQADLVSLSISGDLNAFDPRTGDKPSRIFAAPQKAITAIAPARPDTTFLTGAADGRVYSYAGESTTLGGESHSNLVTGLASSPVDGKVYSIGYDDRVREIGGDGKSYLPASVGTAAQPKSIAVAADGTVFVSEIEHIEAFRSNQKVFDQKPKVTPSSIAASGSTVAIGGENNKVYLNEWDGKSLKEFAVLEGNKGVISALAFSPDGNYLAAGDSQGKVVLFDVKERKTITSRWAFHSARINSLSWTADSKHCASGSLDTNVYVWSVAKPTKNIAIKEAGPGGVNAVLWLEGGRSGKLVSAGADACARIWEVTFHT